MQRAMHTRVARLEQVTTPVNDPTHSRMLLGRLAHIQLAEYRKRGVDLVTPADCDAETWRRIECLRAQERGDWEESERLREPIEEMRQRLEEIMRGTGPMPVDPIEETIGRARGRVSRDRPRLSG